MNGVILNHTFIITIQSDFNLLLDGAKSILDLKGKSAWMFKNIWLLL